MADDVGRFVVGIDADPSGLAAGLQASADQISHFADVASTDIARANAAIGATAPLSAQSLQIATLIAQHRELARTITIEGEQTAATFREASDSLASQLVKMGATEKELDILGGSIKTVEQRYIAMAAAATSAAESQRFGTQFLQTGTIAVPTVTPSQVAGISNLAAGLGNVSTNSNAAGVSLARLRLPLTTIADHALGANRAFGSLSAGILSIGLGTGVTIGLIAGVAALALAYDKLTESSRKAKEDLDKLIKSLDEAANKRVDVTVTMSIDQHKLAAAQSDLQSKIETLRSQLATTSESTAEGAFGIGFLINSAKEADALKQLTQLWRALGEVEASVLDHDFQTTNQLVASTASLIKGQSASNQVRREGMTLLEQNRSLLQALITTQDNFSAAGTRQSDAQVAALRKQTVDVQQRVSELTAAFKVDPGASAAAKFLTDLEKRARDVASAMKLVADAAKFGHLPTSDFSVLPSATVAAFNDASTAAQRFKLTLDQVIQVEEILTKLQNTPAVLVDQARKKFGDGGSIVIPPIVLTAVLDPSWTDVQNRVTDFVHAQQSVPLVLVPEFPPSADNKLTADLSTLLDHVKRAEQDKLIFDIALQLGDSGRGIADEVRAAAQKSLAQAQADAAFALQGVLQGDLDPAAKVAAVQQIEAALRKLTGAAKDVPADLGLQEFLTAGRGVLDIADAFGLISGNVRKVTSGILDSVRALTDFSKAKQADDKLGQITASVGILGGEASLVSGLASALDNVFNGDARRRAALQAEANKALSANDQHLRELGTIINGWVGSISNLQAVSGAVVSGGGSATFAKDFRDTLQELIKSIGVAGIQKLPPGALEDTAFTKFLQGTGVSLGQLEAAARQAGISLFDSAGHVIPGALEQLDEAIRLTITQMTHFQNTLADQRSLADLNANVFDLKQSPLDIVDSWLDTFKKIAPAGFAQIFGSVDIHNAAAVKKAEQDFVTAVENGTIDLAKLGITKDDFIAIINGMETGFDSVTDSANALSQSLRNVPEGFKVAAFEFAAAATEARRAVGSTPTTTVPSSSPSSSFAPGSNSKPSPTASFSFTVAPGAIVVYAAPGDDPKKTAAAVFSQLRQIARTTGDEAIQRFVIGLPQ